MRARFTQHRGSTAPARSTSRVALGAVVVVFLLACLANGQTASPGVLEVSITPSWAHAELGGEIQFSALVNDENGDTVDAHLSWHVIPGRLGRISEAGLFTTGDVEGTGVVRVVATTPGARGTAHAVILVGRKPEAFLRVEIVPSRALLDVEGEQQFDAVVTDAASGSRVEAEITWLVVPADLGVVDADGLFVAGDEDGAGRVVARASFNGVGGLGDAEVVVGPQHDTDLTITVQPEHTAIQPGQDVQFTADVVDVDGAPVPIDVQWSVVPRRLGVISRDGRLTAGPYETAGKVVASIVTEGGFARGDSSVEVDGATPGGVRVWIRPQEVVVTPGDDVQFEARVFAPDGEPMEIPVDWRVRPDWLGNVTSDGFFTASEQFTESPIRGVWLGTIVASVETSEGMATDVARVVIRESAGRLRLRVRPQRAVVAIGENVQFEAEVIGAGAPASWTVEWAVFPENLGTITPDGNFTPHETLADPASGEFGPREGVVRARAVFEDGTVLVDHARVVIRIPGQSVRVLVRPAYAVVGPGEAREFRATVIGPNGQPLDLPIHWSVAPPRFGTIGPDGLFVASDHVFDPTEETKPTGKIVAEVRLAGNRVFRGHAVVVLDLPDPTLSVRVTPKSKTLRAGESFQFMGEVRDHDGGLLDLPLNWNVVDPSVGTIDQNGLFTAAPVTPQGQHSTTQVVASLRYEGRRYWDAATVLVRSAQ